MDFPFVFQRTEGAHPLPLVVCGGTPARFRRLCLRIAALGLFLLIAVPMPFRFLLLQPGAWFHSPPARDCFAQLSLLRRHVGWLAAHPNRDHHRSSSSRTGAAARPLLYLSFLSSAAYELAVQDDSFARPAGEFLQLCLEEAMRPRTYGFSVSDWGVPFDEYSSLPGNALYLGHLNLMLARYRELTGDARYDTLFHRFTIALHRNFERSRTHQVASRPGRCYPADEVASLVSLSVHDRLFRTDYQQAATEWVGWMRGHLDPRTGLLPTVLDAATGEILQPPSGSALGRALPFLFELDPVFARQQYDRFVTEFFVPFGGVGAFRERSSRRRLSPDIDTGPMVFGLGSAATAFGLCAAKAAGDQRVFGAVLGLTESLGLPVSTILWKDYALSPRLGDAVLLWGKVLAPRAAVKPAAHPDGWWSVLYLAVFTAGFAVGLSVLWASVRRAVAGLYVCRFVRDGQLGRATAAVQALRVGPLSPLHRRTGEELQGFVTRSVLLPAPARQEWIRKSNLIGLAFGALAGSGLLLTFGALSAVHAERGYYLIALLLAYVFLGGLERRMDNRLWRRLNAGL